MYVVINELEKDVLREIINIGLARAADSFANYSSDRVLLDVPDIKIIETKVFMEVIEEYDSIYAVVRSDLTGDLNGKTYMLFSEKDIARVADYCLNKKDGHSLTYDQTHHLLLEMSYIISTALCSQLRGLLGLSLENDDPEELTFNEQQNVSHIINDLPEGQPFMITIKTHFRELFKTLELPMLVVFDSLSISKLLHIIRRNNLYDFKLLTKESA